MKFGAFVLSVCMVLLTGVQAEDRGDISQYDNELSERDWEELRNFLNTKRTINVDEKAGNLTISGDVRTEWRHMTERIEDVRLRTRRPKKACCTDPSCGEKIVEFGPNKEMLPICLPSCKPVTHNDFDIELNLYLDYVCEGAWAVGQLQFDNSAGVNDNRKKCSCDPYGVHGSGASCDLNLKKAYMGYNVCCFGDTRFDIELGRRNLYNVFDSRVQFCSRFDGLLLKYSSTWGCMADWYVKAAGFLVDEKVDHFAWIVEGGLLNICDSGLDLKYSLIDWHKHGKNRCGITNPRGMKYLNSQYTLNYHFFAEYMCQPAKLFGAMVVNHHNKNWIPMPIPADNEEEVATLLEEGHRKTWCIHDYELKRVKDQNFAWYIGFKVGEVVCAGDWAFEIQYQMVDPFAIPDDDVSGIARGNLLDERITYAGRGNGNYRGFRIEALYALTDNLNLDAIAEYSQEKEKSYGGRHKYSKFELEAIYAF